MVHTHTQLHVSPLPHTHTHTQVSPLPHTHTHTHTCKPDFSMPPYNPQGMQQQPVGMEPYQQFAAQDLQMSHPAYGYGIRGRGPSAGAGSGRVSPSIIGMGGIKPKKEKMDSGYGDPVESKGLTMNTCTLNCVLKRVNHTCT